MAIKVTSNKFSTIISNPLGEDDNLSLKEVLTIAKLAIETILEKGEEND